MLTPTDYLGGVPVVVRLDERDMTSSSSHPNPAAFVLPRTSLLLSILPDVLALFAPLCASGLRAHVTQVWFSFEGAVPIDWTYPAGAVKDYVAELKRNRRAVSRGEEEEATSSSGNSLPAAPDVDTEALAPLELTLRIRQPTSTKLMEKRVPFFVNFDRLDDFMRNEVRQLHKATYTAMYGSAKLYHNTPASALRPAEGMALYRPFLSDVVAGSSTAGSSTGVGSSGNRVFSSSHLVSDYQHLLREALGRRPAAYVVRLGFPLAASGGGADSLLTFSSHRVPAAPPLALLQALIDGNPEEKGGAAAEGEEVDQREEAVSLGLLLWRLFRVPCLTWLSQQRHRDTPHGHSASAYDRLLGFLAERYYSDAPACATEQLELQEGLKMAQASVAGGGSSQGGGGGVTATGSSSSSSPLPPVPWARWEAAMASRFISEYNGGGGRRRGFWWADATAASLPALPRGVAFEVQGTQPLLGTPAKFLETLMSSSDRSLYITVRAL